MKIAPNTPSNVFLGDTAGTNLWVPNNAPKNKAPLSDWMVVAIQKKMKPIPFG